MGDTSSRSCLLAGTLLVFLSLPLTAQPASLVKDIDPSLDWYNSAPVFLGTAGPTAYFSASHPEFGRELWRTDGTPEGTVHLGDRCPGNDYRDYLGVATLGTRLLVVEMSRCGAPELLSLPPDSNDVVSILANAAGSPALPTYPESSDFGVVNSRLVFSAFLSGSNEKGVYATDGTASGTQSLASFDPGRALAILSAAHGNLLFSVYDPVLDQAELWATDGTAEGTRRIVEIPGHVGSTTVSSGRGRVFFSVRAEAGLEIWASDASPGGTSKLQLLPGPESRILTMSAGQRVAFFVAEDAARGQELWSSDGTPAGTRQVTSFQLADPFENMFSDPINLAVVEDSAFFYAADEAVPESLWLASSEPGSERVLRTLCGSQRCYFSGPTTLDDFVVFPQFSAATGLEPWVTDGTSSGTRLLADTCPGACDGGFELLAVNGSDFYFLGEAQYGLRTVFAGDLQGLQVRSLYDELRRGPRYSNIDHPSALGLGNKLLFSAGGIYSGLGPWVTDGSPVGTFRLTATSGDRLFLSSLPRGFASSGPTLAFFADDDYHSNQTWLSDGTAAGTRQVDEFSFLIGQPAIVGLPSGFAMASGSGILAVDPETSTARVVRALEILNVRGSGTTNGTAVFLLSTWSGTEVWRTDGSEGGTSRTYLLPADWGATSSFRHVGDHLLFQGGPYTAQSGLYSLSATYGSPTRLIPLDMRLEELPVPEHEAISFFETFTNATGESRIWSTNGSATGTHEITPLRGCGLAGATKTDLGYGLLVRSDQTSSVEAWLSDGTSNGSILSSIIPAIPPWSPVQMRSVAGKVYFVLDYQEASWLWSADLSTHTSLPLVQVSRDGYVAFSPDLFSDGIHLYFSKCDESHGCELWVTDGTSGGTELLQDVNPGERSSLPADYFRVENLLYFTADDGVHGRELWVLPLDGGPACRASDTAMCLENGRFRVEADWWDFQGHSGRAQAVPLTADTGTFWFFDPDNVEMILKVLDGTGFNGHHWVYYGALSNVEYAVTITDTETGAAKRLFNPAGRFASAGDITAFGPQGAHASGELVEETTRAGTPPEVLLATLSAPAGLPGSCVPSDTQFCILEDRFAVSATWRDFAGNTGQGHALPLTSDTGYFWFFGPDNVEVVLKMVDGSGYNGKFWIYYGALSNVDYTLTVTDTVAGTQRQYHNPLGAFGSFGDNSAFPAP